MQRELIEQFVDLGNAEVKRALMRTIGTLTGPYDVTLKPRRATRSNQQSRYYFGVVVRSFTDFLKDQGQQVSTEEAHDLLKAKFLSRELVNLDTGEPIGATLRSLTELDVNEMARFIDSCIRWLEEVFGIVVPQPDQDGITRTEAPCRGRPLNAGVPR